MPRYGHQQRKSTESKTSKTTITGLPLSSSSSSPQQQQSNSIKAACLECRSNKVKCKVGESVLACQRCERFGLECRFEAVNRRGRKPKNQNGEVSPDFIMKRTESTSEEMEERSSSNLSNFRPVFSVRKRSYEGSSQADDWSNTEHLFSKPLRSKIWRALMLNQGLRGSTYTFVSSGEVSIAGSSDQSMESKQEDEIQSTNLNQGESSYQPTLRQIFSPFNKRFTGSQRIEANLPLVVRFDTHPDPRAAGVISPTRCVELLTYFDVHLLPWIGIFASAKELSLPQYRWSSTFLLSTVLYLASQFATPTNGTMEERQSLGMHTRSLAIRAFGSADKSLETLLAFNLLTVWKAPDDGYSQLYAGFTDQIATISRTSTSDGKPLSEHDAADALRIQLFHYVQRSVFQLHHMPMTNMIMDQHGVVLPLPTPSPAPPPLLALERFAAGNTTLPSDWFLCANVEGSSIQCKYKSLFKQHQQGKFGSSRNTVGPQIALLEAFFAEMETWEHRWRRRGLRAKELRRSSSQEIKTNNAEDVQQWAGFEILGHSICMQISSIAFRKGLDVWFEILSQTMIPLNDSATAELIQRSYQACLDSAIGLLRRITQLHPTVLVHMPDSTLVLINHAALLVIYLLLLPSAAAEGNQQQQQNNQTTSSSSKQRKQFPEVVGNYTVTQQECLQTLKFAQETVWQAALSRTENTCCALSSEHLSSLIELIEEPIQQQQREGGGRGEELIDHKQVRLNETHSSSSNRSRINTGEEAIMNSQSETPVNIQQNIGWEWLQTFLDDTSVANVPLPRQ